MAAVPLQILNISPDISVSLLAKRLPAVTPKIAPADLTFQPYLIRKSRLLFCPSGGKA